jgi:hypothetical protein
MMVAASSFLPISIKSTTARNICLGVFHAVISVFDIAATEADCGAGPALS